MPAIFAQHKELAEEQGVTITQVGLVAGHKGKASQVLVNSKKPWQVPDLLLEAEDNSPSSLIAELAAWRRRTWEGG